MRHALVDETGNIVNVILWDGETEWRPPGALQAIKDETDEAAPGGFLDGKSFLPQIKPPPALAELTAEDRIGALEQRLAAMESSAHSIK